MAKFCTQCGKKLEEGEICSCQQEKVNAENEIKLEKIVNDETKEKMEELTRKTSNYFAVVWNAFIRIVKSPVGYGTKFVKEEDVKTTCGIIGVYSIIQAIFVLCILKKINEVIDFAGGVFSSYANDNMGNSIQNVLQLSLAKGFLLTVILAVLLSAFYAGILFVVNRIFKENYSFQAMLAVTAVKNTFCILTTLLAIILFVLNPFFGIVVFFLGDFLSICFTMAVVLNQNSPNKEVYIVAIATVIFTFVAVFVVTRYIPFYIPDYIRSGMGEFETYLRNPSMFFQQIMGEMF